MRLYDIVYKDPQENLTIFDGCAEVDVTDVFLAAASEDTTIFDKDAVEKCIRHEIIREKMYGKKSCYIRKIDVSNPENITIIEDNAGK